MTLNRSLWSRLKAGLGRRVFSLARPGAVEQCLDPGREGMQAVYVGNNRILMRATIGGHVLALYLEADDRLLTPWFVVSGRYETDLTDFFLLRLRPDSHCIDVGANFGYFSCLMSRMCPQGKVVGIEADAHVRNLAQDNLYINSLHAVGEILHAAATDRDMPVTLHRRVGRSGNTSIGAVNRQYTDILGEAPAQPFTVGGLTIDSLLPRFSGRVDFMKIDVEGAEPLVFRGARQTIQTNPDLTIVMEWSPGQIRHAGFDVGAFLGDLAAMGLRPSDMTSGQITRLDFGDLLNIDYRAGIVLTRSG